ncbi:hypothetical protein DQ04_02321060 [Trypanosoma grayi]|uniref:hypothetical protein n=1 Tax=Trypanosoma grayi TaxID=71804 RepID=UPI0004F47EFA|nr:hypothetical protein DQ04_02321060 [Trypanosoma grayi]KEG11742.1 hypothetical protein DQ04_02321060 [Trypanosoma grayi]
MVSVPKLLQVLSRVIQAPHPSFTQSHAHAVLQFISSMPADQRSRTDTLNMMKIVLHCPYASMLFARHSKIGEKTVTAFLVERVHNDMEVEEGLRQVIRAVSVSNELSTSVLLTMVRRISRMQRDKALPSFVAAWERDDALADELLCRVVARMPATGDMIRGCSSSAMLTQKAMHKRKCMTFEKPELLFFASTVRHVTLARVSRLGKDRNMPAGAAMDILPANVVDSLVRCVESLPVFSCSDAPLQPDEWGLLAHLICCCDARVHRLGKSLWVQKAQQQQPQGIMDVGSGVLLTSILAGFLYTMRGVQKRDAMELWIDIVTDPQSLPMMKEKFLFMLLGDIAACIQGGAEGSTRERLCAGGERVLHALDALSSFSGVKARLSFTRVLPSLETPEEAMKTLTRIMDVLASPNELDYDYIREVSDFLRYARKTSLVNERELTAATTMLAECTLRLLPLPSGTRNHVVTMVSALISFTAALRDIQAKDSLEEDDCRSRDLFKKIVIEFLHGQPSHAEPDVVSLLLQMMELLDLASDPQYTTAVRELILAALRMVPDMAQDIPPHTAQHCYDVVLRAIRFHVVDEEVLAAASAALRHVTDIAPLRGMNWEQRTLMVERGAAAYRELSRTFSVSKGARRLARQVLVVAALVASEKVELPRTAEVFAGAQYKGRERATLRRCAHTLWSLALRSTLSPIPRTPVDRYVAPLLRFAKKHWISEKLAAGTLSPGGATPPISEGVVDAAACSVDDELSREILDNMLPLLQQIMVSAFTDKVSFSANLRRNKLIISTACDILERNSAFLTPCVWFHAQRTLSHLPAILPGQCTPLQTRVLQAALTQTLHNVRACGNRGTWHLSGHQAIQQQEVENNIILDAKRIGDMFSCADIIKDVDLRAYLILLATEQLAMVDTEPLQEENVAVSGDKKAQWICLNRVIATLRRGVVLYY